MADGYSAHSRSHYRTSLGRGAGVTSPMSRVNGGSQSQTSLTNSIPKGFVGQPAAVSRPWPQQQSSGVKVARPASVTPELRDWDLRQQGADTSVGTSHASSLVPMSVGLSPWSSRPKSTTTGLLTSSSRKPGSVTPMGNKDGVRTTNSSSSSSSIVQLHAVSINRAASEAGDAAGSDGNSRVQTVNPNPSRRTHTFNPALAAMFERGPTHSTNPVSYGMQQQHHQQVNVNVVGNSKLSATQRLFGGHGQFQGHRVMGTTTKFVEGEGYAANRGSQVSRISDSTVAASPANERMKLKSAHAPTNYKHRLLVRLRK
jgi:hypothetical protein